MNLLDENVRPVSPLDENIKKLLCKDSEDPPTTSKDIRLEVAELLNSLVSSGLKDDKKTELLEKYPPPSNCLCLSTPKLNKVIELAVPDASKVRDARLCVAQRQVGAALSALAQTLTFLIQHDGITKVSTPLEE